MFLSEWRSKNKELHEKEAEEWEDGVPLGGSLCYPPQQGKGIYEVRKANKSTPVGSYSGSHMKLWFEGEGCSSSEEQDQSGSATGDSPDSRPQREGEKNNKGKYEDSALGGICLGTQT